MLEVKIEGLAFDMEELQNVLSQQVQFLEEAGIVRRILASLSGLNEQEAELIREVERLEEQQQNVALLLRGLEEISSTYIETEQGICDHIDETEYNAKRMETGLRTGVLDKQIHQAIFI